jgi:hypothetical protein
MRNREGKGRKPKFKGGEKDVVGERSLRFQVLKNSVLNKPDVLIAVIEMR